MNIETIYFLQAFSLMMALILSVKLFLDIMILGIRGFQHEAAIVSWRWILYPAICWSSFYYLVETLPEYF